MQQFTLILVLILAFAGTNSQKGSTRFRYGYNRHSTGKIYGSDNGLKAIALSSASRARTAASNQRVAGEEAAFVAKKNLAEEANEAAATARAALTGKQYAFSKLERQVEDIHAALEAEVRQYQIAERTVNAAKEAANNAEEHVKALAQTLRNAKNAAIQARAAAEVAASESASQTMMVNKARESYSSAYHKLRGAKARYEATKQVVDNAGAAAREAKDNASDAKTKFDLDELSWSSKVPNWV